MSDHLDQKSALRELAVKRAAAKEVRRRRVVELHAQRLTVGAIAKRLGACATWVKETLVAAGLKPWRPCDVDCTGISV
jgi:hypothetical protein